MTKQEAKLEVGNILELSSTNDSVDKTADPRSICRWTIGAYTTQYIEVSWDNDRNQLEVRCGEGSLAVVPHSANVVKVEVRKL